MQDRVSPREARSSYDVYAKPVLMSQPQETKFKQRQRLLSDDQTKQDKQDSRPPTPPGKLQMSKITSMLQSSTTEGSAVLQERPSSPDSHLSGGQPPVLQNGRAKNASETTPRHQAGGSNVPDDVAPSGHKSPGTIAVAEAIAQFEKRIGRRAEESSVAKQSSMASPTEEGNKPLSHRSSQRAEALRQLRELWFSDEAEQPDRPDTPRGTEQPSPRHVVDPACNGHGPADVSCAPQQSSRTSAHSSAPMHDLEASTCNGTSSHEQPSHSSRGKAGEHAADLDRHGSASPVLSRHQTGMDHGEGPSNASAFSDRHLHAIGPELEAKSNGESKGYEQPGHDRDGSQFLPLRAQGGHPGVLPRDDSTQPQQNGRAAGPQRAQRKLHEEVHEPPPVSVDAACVSSGFAASALAKASRLPSSLDRTEQLLGHMEGGADSALQALKTTASQAGEPAWVTGFRHDMGRALGTPFSPPGVQSSNSAEHSTAGVSRAAGTANVHFKHNVQNGGFASGEEEELSWMSSPGCTPIRGSGPARRSAAPVPLRSSHSRSALMQGWRSIMQGSPQQSVGKSLSGVAAQKNGLDLAWRLNEVVHELSSCLARTAEQQQLLNDAAWLLTHGEDEDTDYAAEKLQAADELRQWSEAAQCSSIACLVGILKELQHSRQTKIEEVHLDTSAWLAVLGSQVPDSGSRATRR